MAASRGRHGGGTHTGTTTRDEVIPVEQKSVGHVYDCSPHG
ncbi:hypothetical protein [Streptomyces sp. NPDC051577]